MFDVDLLNNSGIQSNSTDKNNIIDCNIINEPKVQSKTERKDKEVRDNIWNWFFYIFIILFLVFSYSVFNFSSVKSPNDKNNNLTVSYLLKIINSDYNFFKLNSIMIDNNNLKIIIKSFSEEKLYEKLDLFNSLQVDAKALKKNNEYYIYIRDEIESSINESWTILNLKKNIDDFSGVKSEIFNDKLIMVSDLKNLIYLFDLFDRLNVMSAFKFNIENIKSNDIKQQDYYKIILEHND